MGGDWITTYESWDWDDPPSRVMSHVSFEINGRVRRSFFGGGKGYVVSFNVILVDTGILKPGSVILKYVCK